tara:strand:- start:1732 stop:2538 length:807 start_codon:yes stop_codon:yes gene_type:complete
MAYIYSITNNINNKQYIGLTQRDNPYDRWKEHIKSSKISTYPIHCAIRKYGVSNFKFRIVEECSNTIVKEKEQYYIQKYNTFNEGYNATLGGDTSSLSNIRVSCYTKKGVWVKDYDSITEASKEVNGDIGAISRCINGKRFSAYKFRWSNVNDTLPVVKLNYQKVKICAYSKTIGYKEFDSIMECSKILNVNRRNINRSLKSDNDNKRSCNGWYFFFKDQYDEDFTPVKRHLSIPGKASEIGKIGGKNGIGSSKIKPKKNQSLLYIYS